MSGFGAIKKQILERIKLKPLGYKILLEIAYKSKKLGYRISEVPIRFQKRRGGKPKASIKEAIRTLRLIFELKLGLR
jgi:dolichol-phosphate mannosyltransferase